MAAKDLRPTIPPLEWALALRDGAGAIDCAPAEWIWLGWADAATRAEYPTAVGDEWSVLKPQTSKFPDEVLRPALAPHVGSNERPEARRQLTVLSLSQVELLQWLPPRP